MGSTWEEKWIEDIDYLRDNLIKNHINLFHNISKEEFLESINNLKKIINNIDYNEMKVEISRVVAGIKDAHTSVIFPANKYLPLKFYWFEDGIYIIGTTKKYKDLLFKKVIAIEDVKIDEVISDLSNIISYENKYFLKSQSMKYMQVAEVLYGLLIVDDMENIKINLEAEEYFIKTVSPNELIYGDMNLPLYKRNSNENYWFKYLEDKNELYIKYNSCREDGETPLKEKILKSIEFIEKNKINKVTIDLRNNLGGDSTLITPLLQYIKSNKSINKRENLKVIIGRETFSSALLNAYEFKRETNAFIIGEPSGGKPNCYGEILKFSLPNSKFVVSYSTKYYKLIEDHKVMALYPDKLILENIQDYKNNLVEIQNEY